MLDLQNRRALVLSVTAASRYIQAMYIVTRKIRTGPVTTLFSAIFVMWCPLITQAATPNILLINADDLGFGDLSAYGHPIIKTPVLDKLASQGMVMRQFYAPSALCSPSRAALLTGRNPYRTGIKSWIPKHSDIYLRAEELTLAEVLKSGGYSTALIGKWHLNSDLASAIEPQPNDQGFDYFYGHNAFQIPTNRNPVNIFRNREALPTQLGYTAELYASEAIQWLRKRDNDKPFFLYLSMAEPHTSIENPPAANAQYARYTRGEIVPIRSGDAQPPKADLVPRGPGEYYANVSFMDQQLGRVLNELDRQQLSEQTIVVFTSDNGPVTSQWINWYEVNAHGSTGGLRGRKHMLYEGGIRVPAIVRYPGVVSAGASTDQPAVATDLFPTLANLAGANLPDDRPLDGVDISAIWRGESMPERTFLWALDSVTPLEFAYRQGNWKLLLDKAGNPRELYDLASDPLELFELSASQSARVGQMHDDFVRLYKDIEDDPLRPKIEGENN